MKTKALLLAGLVSLAGVATSQAETVYSVNAVGFVNVEIPTGFSLVANPLLNGDNSIAVVLAGARAGTTVYRFNATTGNFEPSRKSAFNSSWNVPFTIAPGEGFFIQNTGTPYTITFTGEVAQGTLVTPLSLGFQLASSQVPQAGRLDTVLGFPIRPGEVVYRFNTATQQYTVHQRGSFNNWTGDGAPTINVGESFFVNKTTAESWSRSFSVSQ